jgi:DNA polymerase III gamma/tau subunit
MSTSLSATDLQSLEGLTSAKRALERLFSGQRNVHAVLFYGAQSSGKSTLAMMLSRYWLCKQPTEWGACGECQACQTSAKGSHPDLQVVKPLPPSFWIKRSAMVPMKESEKEPTVPVSEFLRTAPLSGRHKVIIVEDVDRMTIEAANSWLKLLEEPHPYAKPILTTRAMSRVLPTILSRCLSIVCEKKEVGDVREALTEIVGEDAAGSLMDLHSRMSKSGREQALRFSEELFAISDSVEKAKSMPARFAHAAVLQAFGELASRDQFQVEQWLPEIVEAHRRVLGNGSAPVVFDSLCTSVLRPVAGVRVL